MVKIERYMLTSVLLGRLGVLRDFQRKMDVIQATQVSVEKALMDAAPKNTRMLLREECIVKELLNLGRVSSKLEAGSYGFKTLRSMRQALVALELAWNGHVYIHVTVGVGRLEVSFNVRPD